MGDTNSTACDDQVVVHYKDREQDEAKGGGMPEKDPTTRGLESIPMNQTNFEHYITF